MKDSPMMDSPAPYSPLEESPPPYSPALESPAPYSPESDSPPLYSPPPHSPVPHSPGNDAMEVDAVESQPSFIPSPIADSDIASGDDSDDPGSPVEQISDPGTAATAADAAADPPSPINEEVPDQARRLNELEAVLRQPDAIMEPNIFSSVRDYVVANGHPQQAVEFLTENYVGYAQMASLLCSWLKSVDEPCGNERENAQGTPDQPGVRSGALGGASYGTDPPSHSVMQPGGGDGDSPFEQGRARGRASAEPGQSRVVMDEAYFLRQLVWERFDPQKFAGIFSAGGSGAPKWLNALIADPEGRQLIYKLSSRYQNSLLLNFAVHKILMQPGRDAEVAAVGASLVGFFGVYHRLLGVRLRQAASAGDEAALQRLAQEMEEGASRSQHAYAHAQHILSELAADNGPWAPRFRRLSQELEASVSGPVVWKMRRWFAPPGPSAATAAALVSDILAAAAGGNPAPNSDVIKLHRLYCPPKGTPEFQAEESEAQHVLPPVEVLRHPRLIEVLLQGIFTAGKQLQIEAQAAHVAVLAVAVAGTDLPVDSIEDTDSFNKNTGIEEQPGVISARAALEASSEIAHKAFRDQLLDETDRQRAETALEEPCCAAGVLGMLRSRLTSTDYWAAAYHVHKEAPFFPLLFGIVNKQPGMHADVLALVRDALATAGHSGNGPDVAAGLVRVAISLALAGRVDQVLSWAEQWGRNADSGLVGQFVFGLMEGAAPPYSSAFAASLLRLMTSAGVKRQRVGSREWAARAPLLSEFASGCAALKFTPPLGLAESSLLRELNMSLKPPW